ncbi:uncharacterized protein LOC141660837 [Apium graveolens]|uniref:uncharacterized protein LOC141660837 n=1 Tax=Apium graveolens TaxID=4045 RepID=UPI003D7A25A3
MGRIGIHAFKAVPSTYHMVLKFPTRNSVGEAKGDQKMARSCYVAALRPDRTRGSDVFAWKAADMPGSDPNFITHRLNVDPTRKIVKQKKRTYAPDRLKAIKKEVEKLLEAGFIEEIQFPEKMANPVMVKKAKGKWRMCIDFTGLNDACPKHCYPLPRIDTLIGATAGYEMLSFMDGFSGYNQIKMHKDDTFKVDHISPLGEEFEVLRNHKMMLNPTKYAFGVGAGNFLGHMVSKWGIEANPDKIKAIMDMDPPCSIKDVQKMTGRIAALGSGAGPVLQSLDGFMIEYALKLDIPTTNNEAEYEALIAGLGLARAVRDKNLKVCGDSILVVAQVNGEFKAKDDTMAKYLRVVKGMLTQFDEWYAEHVLKEENTTADALSQFASSEIENYPRSIYFQVLKTTIIHVINLIAPVGVASYWIDPIKTHLETAWLPNNAQEARKLSVRALRYSLIEGLLYKRSFVIPYLKCLRPHEAEEALKDAYEGIYG